MDWGRSDSDGSLSIEGGAWISGVIDKICDYEFSVIFCSQTVPPISTLFMFRIAYQVERYVSGS